MADKKQVRDLGDGLVDNIQDWDDYFDEANDTGFESPSEWGNIMPPAADLNVKFDIDRFRQVKTVPFGEVMEVSTDPNKPWDPKPAKPSSPEETHEVTWGRKMANIRNPYQMPWASSRMKGTTAPGSRYVWVDDLQRLADTPPIQTSQATCLTISSWTPTRNGNQALLKMRLGMLRMKNAAGGHILGPNSVITDKEQSRRKITAV